jgi:hypothetical protein
MMTTAPAPTHKRRKRPFGVNALIFVQFFSLLFSVIALILYAAVVTGAFDRAIADLTADSPPPDAATPNTAEGDSEPIQAMAQLIKQDLELPDIVQLAIEVVLSAVTLYGLWGMRRWAWYLVMLSLGLTMVTELYRYFFDQPDYWSMLFAVVMVFYLNQREVQQAFARHRPEALQVTGDR